MPRSQSRFFIRILCCLFLLQACQRATPHENTPPPDARKRPERIISLAPNLTEMLFALGAEGRIVGVTSYCDYPPAAKTKESIGDTINPNLEKIIALRPDLVFFSTSSQLEKLSQQLQQLNVRLHISNPRTLSEISASAMFIGESIGDIGRGKKLEAEMSGRIEAVRAMVKDKPRLRALYVLQLAPLITAGGNTYLNDVLTIAGAESISAAEKQDYPQYSRETVIARAPEVIIIPESHGDEIVNEAQLRRDYAETPAIRHNRIIRINPDLLNRPGPRIVDGLETLARAIHETKAISK